MAILKHIAIKNTHYDAALDYLTMQHDEFTMKPLLGEDGRQLPREEYLLDGINCNPYTFAMECESVNASFQKNQNKADVKAHHYIISFDPRDRDENGLTLETAQKLAIEYAKKNFPGHQTLICAHPDGHNSVDSGRKECPLRYGGAGFRFGRRETPEIFGCDYLAVEMDDGDISFPFISMR